MGRKRKAWQDRLERLSTEDDGETGYVCLGIVVDKKKYIFSKEEKSNTVTQCWHHILGENVQGRSFLCFCFFLVRYHGAYRASYFNKVLRFNEFITGGHALCHHGKQNLAASKNLWLTIEVLYMQAW